MSEFQPGQIVHSQQYGTGKVITTDGSEKDPFGKPMPVTVEFESGAVRHFTAGGQLQHGTIDWQFMISPYRERPKGRPSEAEIIASHNQRVTESARLLRCFVEARPNDVIALAEGRDGTHCLRHSDLARVVWAAEQYLKAQPTDWQPISTAPKDGTWILLAGGETDEDDDFADSNVQKSRPVTAFWDESYDVWQFCYWDMNWRSGYKNPTHWMPLPELKP